MPVCRLEIRCFVDRRKGEEATKKKGKLETKFDEIVHPKIDPDRIWM